MASRGVHLNLQAPATSQTPDTESRLHFKRTVWLASAVLILTGVWLAQSPANTSIMLGIHTLDMGPDAFWSFATQFGDAGAAFLLLLVLSRFSPASASLVLKCLLLGSILSRVLKDVLASPRPLGVLDPSLLSLIGDPPSGPNSMPSGHAMTAAALVCLMLWMHPKVSNKPYVWIPLLAWGAVVALSRVVVGAHWPADILVGFGLGLAVTWLAWEWEQRHSWAAKVNSVPGQYLLILLEMGLVIALFASQTDTPAARWAFDLIATVGIAGAMARYASLRRRQVAHP